MSTDDKPCYNCGAVNPGAGLDQSRRVVCCEHCIFNPVGCRCKYGDFGKPQEFVGHFDDDEDHGADFDFGDGED